MQFNRFILFSLLLSLILGACTTASDAPETATVVTENEVTAKVETTGSEESVAKPVIDPTAEAMASLSIVELSELLLTAVREDDLDLSQKLLEAGADLSYGGDFDTPPIAIAIVRGNTDIVQLLLDSGVDVNTKDASDISLLVSAVESGNLDMVSLLLENGAVVENVNEGSNNPLMQAAQIGHVEIGEMLIEHGADIHVPDTFGDPPLAWTGYFNQPEFAQMLLDAGALPDYLGTNKITALDYAISQHSAEAEVVLAPVTSENPSKALGEVLLTAVRDQDLRMVEVAIEGGADLTITDEDGKTVLDFAVAQGYSEVAELLREAGASE